MSEREERDARRAQAELRRLPLPEAAPAFRARLRASFADGSLARDEDPAGALVEVGAEGLGPRPRPPLSFPVRRPFLVRHGAWLGGAAAAAVLAVYALVGFNPGPHWQVAQHQQAHGNVLVDDDAIPADDMPSLTDALIPGAKIEWNGEGDLLFVSPGQLALAVPPGTRFTLPKPPPRFFDRIARAQLDSGRLRLTTGPDFHGARAVVTTPEAQAWVTGTTLTVIRDAMGTCVCVGEGRVRVMRTTAGGGSGSGSGSGPGGQDLGMTPQGERQVVYRAAMAREPERTPILPTEQGPLAALREGMRGHWHEPSPAR